MHVAALLPFWYSNHILLWFTRLCLVYFDAPVAHSLLPPKYTLFIDSSVFRTLYPTIREYTLDNFVLPAPSDRSHATKAQTDYRAKWKPADQEDCAEQSICF